MAQQDKDVSPLEKDSGTTDTKKWWHPIVARLSTVDPVQQGVGQAIASSGENLSKGIGNLVSGLGDNVVSVLKERHDTKRLALYTTYLNEFAREEFPREMARAKQHEAALEAEFARNMAAADQLARLESASSKQLHEQGMEAVELEARLAELGKQADHVRDKDLLTLKAVLRADDKILGAQLTEAASAADHGRRLELLKIKNAIDEQKHRREIDREHDRAVSTLLTAQTIADHELRREHNPFKLAPNLIREMVGSAVGTMPRPVLLLAPLDPGPSQNTDGVAVVGDYEEDLRRLWEQAPLPDDFVRMTGLFRRPLTGGDLDRYLIRETLRDLPVILVQCVVESDGRLRVDVTAWNLGPGTGAADEVPPVVTLSVPVPAPPAEERRVRRKRSPRSAGDAGPAVAVTISVLVGMLGEWFHIAHSGREPSLHRRIPAEWASVRQPMAVTSAAMFDAAVDAERVDALSAAIRKSRLYEEVGMSSASRVSAGDAVDLLLGDGGRWQSRAWTDVVGLLERIGAADEARQLRSHADRMAEKEVNAVMPWGGDR